MQHHNQEDSQGCNGVKGQGEGGDNFGKMRK